MHCNYTPRQPILRHKASNFRRRTHECESSEFGHVPISWPWGLTDWYVPFYSGFEPSKETKRLHIGRCLDVSVCQYGRHCMPALFYVTHMSQNAGAKISPVIDTNPLLLSNNATVFLSTLPHCMKWISVTQSWFTQVKDTIYRLLHSLLKCGTKFGIR
jgi:hypothetical protein